MNNIITFYSYKGGVGRTMSLVNVALVMAGWGLKVLIIDWDLEAPGIEYFFAPYLRESLHKGSTGIIDLLERKLPADDWEESINHIDLRLPGNIDYISSGKRDARYFERIRSFDLDAFYKAGGGDTIESLREKWAAAYDFVLIDSRTGVTEMGGLCTIQLPDIVVLLFTATEQGFEGALDIARRSARSQQLMPFSRQKTGLPACSLQA
jgi:MinD-like ATPase involved in chromosome partitioning or flagellar assembly